MQTLTPVEHVKRRREMYFGCACISEPGEWVGENSVVKTGTVNKGLQKLFDELFANAGDWTPAGAKIRVTYDPDTGRFCIENPTGIRVHLMEDGETWSVVVTRSS